MFYWVMLAKEGVILGFFVRNDLNWKTKFSCRASICFWYKNGGVFLEKIWNHFQDGVGMFVVENAEGDTVTLSMIAEKENLWTRGQSHDQQDNLSITLASSKKVFWKIFGACYEFRVEGGYDASVLNKQVNDVANKIVGYSAETKIDNPTTVTLERDIHNS